jgi:alanine dehydrogenase
MLIGVPKEIKNHEYRVGITPAGVKELVTKGHHVIVQHLAGDAIGLTDELYRQAGATIINSAKGIYKELMITNIILLALNITMLFYYSIAMGS